MQARSRPTYLLEAVQATWSTFLRTFISCAHWTFSVSVLSCHPNADKPLDTSPSLFRLPTKKPKNQFLTIDTFFFYFGWLEIANTTNMESSYKSLRFETLPAKLRVPELTNALTSYRSSTIPVPYIDLCSLFFQFGHLNKLCCCRRQSFRTIFFNSCLFIFAPKELAYFCVATIAKFLPNWPILNSYSHFQLSNNLFKGWKGGAA